MSKPTILKGEEAEKYVNEMFGGPLPQISENIAVVNSLVKEFTSNPDEWEVRSVSYTKTEEGIDEEVTLYNAAKNSSVKISISNADQLGK